MNAYADPYIAPDMSNYYRLLREKQRRLQIRRDYPAFEQTIRASFDEPAVKSFLQAIPTQNIRSDDEPEGVIQPGVVSRGIEISNSIIERKVFLLRIAEGVIAGEQAADDLQTAKSELAEYCDYLGLSDTLSNAAIDVVTRASENVGRANRFKLVPEQTGPKF